LLTLAALVIWAYLASLYEGRSLNHWVAQIRDPDPEKVEQARQVLRRALDTEDDLQARVFIASILLRAGTTDHDALSLVLEGAGSKDHFIRMTSVTSLIFVPEDPRVVRRLIQVLDDDKWEFQNRVADALSGQRIWEQQDTAALLNLADNGKKNTRVIAIRLLGNTGNPAIVPSLRKHTEDPCPDIREEIENALRKLPRPPHPI
jgi:HEAT repeat protein